MGALPYGSDLTPALTGTLWSDTTLSAAGSPYAVTGDLIVPSGVTDSGFRRFSWRWESFSPNPSLAFTRLDSTRQRLPLPSD